MNRVDNVTAGMDRLRALQDVQIPSMEGKCRAVDLPRVCMVCQVAPCRVLSREGPGSVSPRLWVCPQRWLPSRGFFALCKAGAFVLLFRNSTRMPRGTPRARPRKVE